MNTEPKNHPVIAMDSVDSSQISAIGHDAETNTLAIMFAPNRSGLSSVYHYSNFTADDFAAFRAAESKGRHFKEFIKLEVAKHPFVKVDAVVAPVGGENV